MKKAVCLLSGGLDSTVCLYTARAEGYETIALSFQYGQRHERELSAARDIAASLHIKHYTLPLSLPWEGSALLDKSMVLPKNQSLRHLPEGIPSTYVPARNSIFLSMAVSCAEAEDAEAVFIGVNALDYSGYPDCRPDFLEAFRNAMERGTKVGVEGRPVEIKAPLLKFTKKEIVLLGKKLGVPFKKTWSCYEGGAAPCGTCDSCLLRAKGFEEAGTADPAACVKYPAAANRARISEIFSSLQGEGPRAGERHLFIRFEECHLGCWYCDELGKKGEALSLTDVLREVDKLERAKGPHAFVSLTGGEPLLHPSFLKRLCRELKAHKFRVLLETNGILWRALEEIAKDCDVIAMDLKLPSVGQTKDFLEEHRKFLAIASAKETYIKIVVSRGLDLGDYETHLRMVATTAPQVPVFLQPVTGERTTEEDSELIYFIHDLRRIGAQWLPDIRIGLRLHKMLNIP